MNLIPVPGNENYPGIEFFQEITRITGPSPSFSLFALNEEIYVVLALYVLYTVADMQTNRGLLKQNKNGHLTAKTGGKEINFCKYSICKCINKISPPPCHCIFVQLLCRIVAWLFTAISLTLKMNFTK